MKCLVTNHIEFDTDLTPSEASCKVGTDRFVFVFVCVRNGAAKAHRLFKPNLSRGYHLDENINYNLGSSFRLHVCSQHQELNCLCFSWFSIHLHGFDNFLVILIYLLIVHRSWAETSLIRQLSLRIQSVWWYMTTLDLKTLLKGLLLLPWRWRITSRIQSIISRKYLFHHLGLVSFHFV